MVMSGGNARTLSAVLSLRDQMTPQLKKAARETVNFRTELRRASIQLGIMAGAGAVMLRGWLKTANDNREAFSLISSAIKSFGGSAETMTPKVQELIKSLSKESGVPIADIAKTWTELMTEFENADYASQLLGISTAIQAITGTAPDAEMLRKALAGEEGAVEEMRKLTGINLAGFNTEGERLEELLGKLSPRLSENKAPMDDFSSSLQNLKDKLGSNAQEQLNGPLKALADVMDRFAENEDMTRIASDFMVIGVGLLTLGAGLSGLLWLSATHPVVLGLIAAAGAVSAIIVGWQELQRIGFGINKDGMLAGKTSPNPFAPDKGDMGQISDKKFMEQVDRWVQAAGGWSGMTPDTVNQIYGDALARGFAETPEFKAWLKMANEEMRLKRVVGDGSRPPGWWTGEPWNPFDPEHGEQGATPWRVTNINLYSNGDIDYERRAREIAERMGESAYRRAD